ncbi:hypothetical protein DPV78_010905 [Talaromyces pinophilus]|nr:hypothetical protein DPV78_010905 [Talaromyces pinophilus]
MDHIPNLQRPVHEHIRVPYLFGEEYVYEHGGKAFYSFPERHGWDLSDIIQRNFRQNGVEDPLRAASFLQAWLFFGLMSEVLKTNVLTGDFIQEIDDQKFITTKSLQKYIDNWQDEINSLSDTAKEERLLCIIQLFKEADTYFKVATQSPPGEAPSPLPPEVQLSLSILHATLFHATMHIFRKEEDPSPLNNNEFVIGFPVEFIETLLQDQGWCPSDIELLKMGGLGSTSNLELYYAYLLGKRGIIRDHSHCKSSFVGRFTCMALNVSESDYEPAHVPGCQRDCDAIEVDQNWLEEVVQGGRLPLISISIDDSGAAYLETQSSDYEASYVAISHVYADGLGNPRKCALPTCQLTRLQSRVNNLNLGRRVAGLESANLHFWMDTLCIPVRDDLYHVRKMAIRSMAKIYTRAQIILVLNAELEYHSCHASSEEVLMRTSTTGWFRRLWTLQEGVLANKIYFQFRDGAINIESQVPPYEGNGNRFSVHRRLIAQAIKPYARIRAFRAMSKEQRIREIYALAQWRTTSRDADEPYCLATLLLTDQTALYKITATKNLQKRREEFIMGQGLFPEKALFFMEPRIGTREPPIGWALRKYFYRGEPEAIPVDNPLAPVDSAGWHIRLAGITFSATDLPVEPVDGHWLPEFTFGDEDKAITLQASSCIWLRDERPPKYWTDILSEFKATKIGIIIETWPLEYQEGPKGFRSYWPTRGAIVAITNAVDDKFDCFFCGTVVLSRASERGQKSSSEILSSLLPGFDTSLLTNDLSLLQLVPEGPSGSAQKGKSAVKGQLFDGTQEWCVK